ncbi:hypothetical protein EQM14_06920 [Caproiciproducens sp. NJN-50]|uniref:hypothetical protein n=1 Tax=Acutalibacteraceae TaxID=3082771 RepID=UPI000FFE2F39|nr:MULTISPECIES: hypothetical protein [Acutalibacteraceae]QAT49531.1 hypothetical protein EQM14_06920 [Caproiciproducens sp. NJN-50]
MGFRRAMALAAVFVTGFILCGTLAFQAVPAAAAETKTGVGLSEHALMAYRDGWKYQYGNYGQYTNGVRSTDCSGLVKSYLWWRGNDCDPEPNLVSVAGSSQSMLSSAKVKGTIRLSDSSTLPRIHGLILYSPGHVGIYVGGNKSVDNRCTGENVKYGDVIGGNYHWTTWFKLPQVSYPENGFVTFDGNQYYYENGQYVVDTSRTIDGVTYTFDHNGVMSSSN